MPCGDVRGDCGLRAINSFFHRYQLWGIAAKIRVNAIRVLMRLWHSVKEQQER
jgi:hypothetical protein